MVNDLDLVSSLPNLTKELRLGITMIPIVRIDKNKVSQDWSLHFYYFSCNLKLALMSCCAEYYGMIP